MSRKLTYDSWLFGAAMLIVVLGIVMIYSASAMIALQRFGVENPYHFMTRQLVWLFAGGALMLLLMHIDITLLQDRRVLYAILTLVGLILILFVAAFLARREERINELTTTVLPIASILCLFAGLILLGRDFGTATVVLLVGFAMIFVAGVPWRLIGLISIPLVPAIIALGFGAAYRRDRVFAFLNPEADPLGKGFQALQSLIALGTGGLKGLGIGNGRQKLFFLPEPHTDFIFSIVGEELGFIGAFMLIAAFAFLVWRGFRVARYGEDRFAFYAALGLTLMIGLQALINISVSLCLLPTKGIGLPLVSYGGSSLIASLMAIGILLNLSQQSG